MTKLETLLKAAESVLGHYIMDNNQEAIDLLNNLSKAVVAVKKDKDKDNLVNLAIRLNKEAKLYVVSNGKRQAVYDVFAENNQVQIWTEDKDNDIENDIEKEKHGNYGGK